MLLVFACGLVLAITSAFAASPQTLKSYPLALDDVYEMGVTGEAIELRVDDQGTKWTAKANLLSLNVIRNDEIVDWIPKTCVLKPLEGQNSQPPSNQTEGFKDVAEDVGFNHDYRIDVPTRPYCLFHFIIPTANSSVNIRLKGEFCVPELLSAGAAVADYDGDGYPDIFFAVHHSRSKLYRNNGDGTFTDVTVEANVGPLKYGSGAVWADFDADGDLDLYVTTLGDTRHYLYINQGGRFSEEAVERNVSATREDGRILAGMSSNVGDFNRDGYPDLYTTEWRLLKPSQDSSSRLFQNLGSKNPGHFKDVTEPAGVEMDWLKKGNPQAGGIFTFASSFTDFDEDGWPELVITADYGDSQVFWNNHDGTFTRCTEQCGVTRRVDAMGHAIGDWNADQHLDWFSTGIHQDDNKCEVLGCSFGNNGNSLFTSEGQHVRKFTDSTDIAGVREGYWGWGGVMFDFNNDKFIDFIMTNGFDSASTTTDDAFRSDPTVLWKNQGPSMNLSTVDVAIKLGINHTRSGRGLLKVDYDGDGDEDVLICHNIGKPSLFKNLAGNKNFWLRVKVMHQCPGSRYRLCDSLNARIKVTTVDGWVQTQEIGCGAHFMAQNEIEAHFGLGNAGHLVDVHVYWPASNVWVNYTGVPPNSRLRVVAPVATKESSLVNESVSFSKLDYCPTLKVTAITKTPQNGTAWVNSDGTSIGLLADHPGKAQELSLEYTVTVDPPSVGSGLSASASLWLFIKETPNGGDNGGGDDNECNEVFPSTSERRFDGRSNNMNYTRYGSLNQLLKRDFTPVYSDQISTPAAQCSVQQKNAQKCPFPAEYLGEGSTRPSPRLISNTLFAQHSNVYSKRNINDLVGQFGQFLAHDTDFSSPLPRFEFETVRSAVWFPISIPKGDVHFDPGNTGNEHFPFIRSTYDRVCTGQSLGNPREQINKLTSIIDASMVYGLAAFVNNKLRTMKDGKMILENGGIIPYNTMSLPNDNPVGRPPAQLLAAGDTRSNVQPGLIALHSLFVREHNRQCDEYKRGHLNATDAEIFSAARRMVIAETQAITFREFLPALVGRDMPPYMGYNSSVNPDVGNAFATAAFRYGHSQVNSHLWRLDKNWTVIAEGHLPLRDSYFAPERVIREGGIDPLLRGFTYQSAQAVDTQMVDDMRNVLFPVGRRDGLDLASMNIQRGRDHGLPSYNLARVKLGLPRFSNFSDFSDDKEVVRKIEDLYVGVDDVDMWVGGLAEEHVNGSELGSFFETLLLKNFFRIRDGDRFWYENIMSKEEQALVNSLTLSEIIRLNTDFKDVPDAIFFSSKYCSGMKDHQCLSKKEESTCEMTSLPPTMTDKAKMISTSTPSGTTSPTTQNPTSEAVSTASPSTSIPSTPVSTISVTKTTTGKKTSLPTTAPPGISCCQQFDNCTAEKDHLNYTLVDTKRNNSAALFLINTLQETLSMERASTNSSKSLLLDLQLRCASVEQERDALNLTVMRQSVNLTRLQKQFRQSQADIKILEGTLNVTGNQLKQSVAQAVGQLQSCQFKVTTLEADRMTLQNSLKDLQKQYEMTNSSLANVTIAFAFCSALLPVASSTLPPPVTSKSSTTVYPVTSNLPFSTPAPTDVPTSSPCPSSADPDLVNQLIANLSKAEQLLISREKVAKSLQAQLNQSQVSLSKLAQDKKQLKINASRLTSQLNTCDGLKTAVQTNLSTCLGALSRAQASQKPTPTPSPTTNGGAAASPSDDRPTTLAFQFQRLQEEKAKLSEENDQIRSENFQLVSENAKARANISALRQEMRGCPTREEQSDSCSSVSFNCLIGSTPGIVAISVSGALFVLFLLFLVLYIHARVKPEKSSKSQSYEFATPLPQTAFGDSPKGYSSAEDAFY